MTTGVAEEIQEGITTEALVADRLRAVCRRQWFRASSACLPGLVR